MSEVRAFTQAVLHGDVEHREWLTAAAEAFIAGEPLPPPNGKGRAESAEARVELLERALREIAEKDVHPYIQIGDDPNFPGETLMLPGQYAKIALAVLEPIQLEQS